MNEDTVLIKIRDGDPLCVSIKRLTTDSKVFRRFILELRYEEIEMDDFSPDAVALFLSLLEDRSLSVSDIQSEDFRELHKMSVVFEVEWLTERCSEWLNEKIEIIGEADLQFKQFLLEECLYILRKWDIRKFVDFLVSKMIELDNTEFIAKCMENFEKVDQIKMDLMLILGGSDPKLFLELIIQNIDIQQTLHKNTKYLMENINLRLCLKVNFELYHELFCKISTAENIRAEDLAWAFKLSTDAEMQVVKRDIEMKTSKRMIYSTKNISETYGSYALKEIAANILEGSITSMFVAVELTVEAFYRCRPTLEEIEDFQAQINDFSGGEKPVKRVSTQFLDLCITALKSSHPSLQETATAAIKILTNIKNEKKLSSHQENVHLSSWCGETNSKRVTNVFRLSHPENQQAECKKDGECGFRLKFDFRNDDVIHGDFILELCKDVTEYEGSGVHYHEEIEANDMYFYTIWSAKLESDTTVTTVKVPSRRWLKWFVDSGHLDAEETCVDYNIRNHLVLASHSQSKFRP